MAKFQLYFPIKPKFINQGFGGNAATYAQFGLAGHNGIDFQAYHGQPVYASHDGQAWYEIDENQGHGVVVTTNERFDYTTLAGVSTQAYFKSIYWHFCDSNKEPQFKSPVEGYVDPQNGLPVKAGDLIGYADTTGFSTGDHLHFGLKPQFLHYPADYTNIEQKDGYLGAIDPTPYFNGLFAQDISTSKYPFLTNMGYGDQSNDVMQLQMRLTKEGIFPINQTPTGFYGPKTAAAVLAYQVKHQVDTPESLQNLGGRSCGPKTRAALNSQ
jgi:hypothetical protein